MLKSTLKTAVTCPPDACSRRGVCVSGSPPGSRNHRLSYYCDCFTGYQANQDQTDCIGKIFTYPINCSLYR